jgi:peptidylprolyl isomerase
MRQAGYFTAGNGTGGNSLFGMKFPYDNFTSKNTGKGILSMANADQSTKGSHFFICFIQTQ